MTTAFVLGGGGQLGAHEAGMLRALLERGVVPDMVVGTSVGAINGAAIATSPSVEMARRLGETWRAIEKSDVFAGSLFGRLATLARTGTHLHANEPLRATLTEALEITLIEDLPVRFQCVAASIEAAAEHWFSSGPLGEAVMASAAVPGLLPPVEIAGEHFLDGGIVNSIPVDRALSLGATRIFVMHVGRADRPLAAAPWPWEVALGAFESGRRPRFVGDLAAIPDRVEVHVMPTGQPEPPRYNDLSALRYRATSGVSDSIARAYAASAAYLEEHGL